MKDKSPQEESAAIRQVQLINGALLDAKRKDGVWLNQASMMAPRIYPKGPTVSPFNSLILQLQSDAKQYSSSQYVFFHTAKALDIPVQNGEKGVPFNWYAWNRYVDRHNPDNIISAEDYKKLPDIEKERYKGVQERQIRMLFNIEQTILPDVEHDKYRDILDTYGTSNERGNIKSEEKQLRSLVNAFVKQMKDYLVPIRREASSVAYYDTEKDAVYMPDQKKYASYPEYVQELMRQIVSATGHRERLAREGMVMNGGHTPGEHAERCEKLVVEVASAIKMSELGLPAKILPQNLDLVDKWTRELQENPCMVDALETDVNNALEVIRKAEQGEKVEYARFRTQAQIDELKSIQRPQVDSREAAILSDILRQNGMKIDDRNFKSAEERDSFLDKFNLIGYDKELREAMAMTGSNDAEVVEIAYDEALRNAASIQRLCREYLPERWGGKDSHYIICDQLRQIPNEDERSLVVIKDSRTNIYDVILPGGGAVAGGYIKMPDGVEKMFRFTPDEVMSKEERVNVGASLVSFNAKGMPKDRIEAALRKDGALYVRFFNPDGQLGYNAEDRSFEGKTVHEMTWSKGQLQETAVIEVAEAVKAADDVIFDKVQLLKDDDKRWAFYIKAQNEPSFCIYPEKDDINRFFSTLHQGKQEEADRIRMELGRKYYEMAKANPSVRFDLFSNVPDGIDLARISRVNVYKTREDKIMCAPRIEGVEKVYPREITRDQWNRMFVAEDMAEYKTCLAARLFADVLRPQVNNDVKVGQHETEDISVSKGISR